MQQALPRLGGRAKQIIQLGSQAYVLSESLSLVDIGHRLQEHAIFMLFCQKIPEHEIELILRYFECDLCQT